MAKMGAAPPRVLAARGGAGAATTQEPNTTETIATRLRALEHLDYVALHREWRRLYRMPAPPRVSRDLLLLGVAWKAQEQLLGSLGTATRRRLMDLMQNLERDGDVTRSRAVRLRPGARLVREWRGETHTIIVLDDGFEWRGRRWRSLSAIAREISGGHWSGPRFFGLTGSRVEDPSDA
jgi:hypothetical protein